MLTFLIFALALTVLIIGLVSWLGNRAARKRYMQTIGTIVSIAAAGHKEIWIEQGERDEGYYPMVQYTIHTGQQFTLRDFECTDLQPGDQVIVLYDPAEPANFLIKS